MAPALARALARGGRAILSGFVARDVERVLEAHRRRRLRLTARFDRDPWAALVVHR
jgi:ribosomal protein L11 methyltransferase